MSSQVKNLDYLVFLVTDILSPCLTWWLWFLSTDRLFLLPVTLDAREVQPTELPWSGPMASLDILSTNTSQQSVVSWFSRSDEKICYILRAIQIAIYAEALARLIYLLVSSGKKLATK